jgi:Tfp pilus assembly protein PilN
MRAVNLLPEDARPGSRWATVGRGASARRVLGGSGVAAGVLALAFAGLTLHQRGVVDERRTDLHDVQARLVAAQAQAVEVQQAQTASLARFSALQTLVAQRVAWEDVLRDLARVLPGNVFLQSLQAAAPTLTAAATPEAGAVPTGFTVTGAADSQVRVAQVLDRLSLLPWLSDVTLQSSIRGQGEGATPVQFAIGASIGSTGGER